MGSGEFNGTTSVFRHEWNKSKNNFEQSLIHEALQKHQNNQIYAALPQEQPLLRKRDDTKLKISKLAGIGYNDGLVERYLKAKQNLEI